jgi:ribosomal protein L11 methyltransferase
MSVSRPWLELAIDVEGREVDALVECLEALGAMSVSLANGDAGRGAGAETEAAPPWPSTRVTGLFESGVSADALLGVLKDLPDLPHPLRSTVRLVADRDWEQAVRDAFQPICVGGRLWIRPGWQPAARDGRAEIVLDPGMAFGTGDHASTRLCLEWLCRSRAIEGASVIDYGCGSGILAIAAARFGARRVWAVDVDPLARQIARSNVARNRVGGQVTVVAEEALEAGAADVLIANILLEPLVALAGRFGELLRAGGRLVLAGITAAQAQRCEQAYSGAFRLGARRPRGDWILVEATRRAPGAGRGPPC